MSKKLDLAFLALGGPNGRERNKIHCKCDPEVGLVPCRYCAIYDALTEYQKFLDATNEGFGRSSKFKEMNNEIKKFKDKIAKFIDGENKG